MVYTNPQPLRALKTITTTTSLTLLYWTDIITSYYPPPYRVQIQTMYVCMYVCMYVYVVVQFHPWFKILCPFVLKLIIIHYHTSKQREIKLKPRIRLNHSIYNPNPINPMKWNYYFYLSLEMCFWDSSCQWQELKWLTKHTFFYLLLRLSFFQSSMLNTQGPGSYGAGWSIEPPPTSSPGFF